jgi:hypothetical protein
MEESRLIFIVVAQDSIMNCREEKTSYLYNRLVEGCSKKDATKCCRELESLARGIADHIVGTRRGFLITDGTLDAYAADYGSGIYGYSENFRDGVVTRNLTPDEKRKLLGYVLKEIEAYKIKQKDLQI